MRQYITTAIESQRALYEKQLAGFLNRHLPSQPKAEDIQRVVENYEKEKPSMQTRLLMASYFGTILFGGTLIYILTHINDVVEKQLQIEALYIPASVCVISLFFTLIAHTWKK